MRVLRRAAGLVISATLFISMAGTAMATYETGIDGFKCRGMNVPAYNGSPYAIVNNNKTSFTAAEKASRSAYEIYSDLDSKGRVGSVSANIEKSSLPTGGRGNISSIYPTGWKQHKYDTSLVDGGWLFNRSHLYAHCLGGDDIKKNLCTGSRFFNVNGMNYSAEQPVLDYIKKNGGHVLYRVTPVFKGDDLLAKGVLIEAETLETEKINLCLFCYNVQPGIALDYATGDNILASDIGRNIKTATVKKIKTMTYTGKKIKPACHVSGSNGGQLAKGKDYTVSYFNNIKPGKAGVTIRGKGSYTGFKTVNFLIKPAKMKIKSASAEKNEITIKWKKHPGVTGYQVRCREADGSFKKEFNVSRFSSSTDIYGLEAGTKYKIQMRAYRTVDGKKIYGKYSSKTKKTK